MNEMLLRTKKAVFTAGGEKLKRLQLYVCQTFGKHFVLFIYLSLSLLLFFFFFADNFIGSKDTEPYKMDVSFLCQYTI